MHELLHLLDPDGTRAYSLGRIDPPYTEVKPLRVEEPPSAPVAPGRILVIRSELDPSPDCPLLAAGVNLLRVRFPTAPVVVELRALTPASLSFALAAQRLNLRAVIVRGSPPGPPLRSALTRPQHLGRDTVDWLRLRRVPLSPALGHVVRHLVGGGGQPASLTQLLRAARAAPSSLRTHLRRKQLPSPGSWHRLGRALHVALRIQAEPGRSLLVLAHECGHSDHASLIRQFTGCFGIRPGEVRGTLGWEWLLDRWVALTFARGAGAGGRAADAQSV